MTSPSAETPAGVPIPDGAAIGTGAQDSRGRYVARLRLRLTAGMIAAFIVPVAVFRARNITRKLSGFARTHTPHLTSTRIHKLLDDVVGVLKEREFAISNIKLIRDYDLRSPS